MKLLPRRAALALPPGRGSNLFPDNKIAAGYRWSPTRTEKSSNATPARGNLHRAGPSTPRPRKTWIRKLHRGEL